LITDEACLPMLALKEGFFRSLKRKETGGDSDGYEPTEKGGEHYLHRARPLPTT